MITAPLGSQATLHKWDRYLSYFSSFQRFCSDHPFWFSLANLILFLKVSRLVLGLVFLFLVGFWVFFFEGVALKQVSVLTSKAFSTRIKMYL